MEERRIHRRRLASGPGVILDDVQAEGGPRHWSRTDLDVGYAVILVRRGGFVRWSDGEEAFVDVSGGYLSRHGAEERFAYPLGGTDLCTVIGFSPDAYAEHIEPQTRASWWIATDAGLDLRHRLTVSACRRGLDRFEAAEALTLLVSALPPRQERQHRQQTATDLAHRRLVLGVQEALSNGHLSADLPELARLVGASPHHLSRTFRRVTGRTISAYRNELRVRAVLEDIAAGAPNLATLAAAYGFADQAHLTRTVRRLMAEPPTVLRGKLSTNVQVAPVWPG